LPSTPAASPCCPRWCPSIWARGSRTTRHARPGSAREGLALGALVTAGFLLVFVVAGVLVSLGAGSVARGFPWATVFIGAALVGLGLWLYLGGSLSVRVPHLQAARVVGSPRAMFVYGIAYALASLGCTLPIFLIAVGAALAAGPVGSLVLFVAY